ncbi:ESPR domain-containing protein [Pantoea ananatis]
MNRAYRIVWSAARQAWGVASEKAASGGRPPLAVKKAAAAFLPLGMTGSALATDYGGSKVTRARGCVLKVNADVTSRWFRDGRHAFIMRALS